MLPWSEFARQEPALAADGERVLLLHPTPDAPAQAGLAYLATVRADGGPRIHPIAPVLYAGRLYAFVLRASPKCRDLLANGHYALHAFPYPLGDFSAEEFTVSGRARHVEDDALRAAVAERCGDAVEAGEIFELLVERALHRAPQWNPPSYRHWRAAAAR
jgi:hypothetical protein